MVKRFPHPTNAGADPAPAIIMYSTAWCGDCHRARRVFAALGVPYRDIDIEQDEVAAALVTRLNHGARSVPTILFPDGTALVEPARAVLETKLRPYMP